jgi:hypothetical protein
MRALNHREEKIVNLSEPYARVIFFLVPSLLLLVATLAARRKLLDGPLGLIAGSDNRLSLARSQALAWTLVIFGSFAAAMAIHPNAVDKSGKSDWVIIPTELLALAGIAIGSGIFSSLISAVNSEEKTAVLTAVGDRSLLNDEEAVEAGLPATAKPLVIKGRNLGTTGKVRLGWGRMGKEFAQELFWKSDGTLIVVGLPPQKKDAPDFGMLVVDTTNGKLSYKISRIDVTQPYALGEQQRYLEFADLFRDDKNPANFDLMKFQMFGWTVVAIFIYSCLFLKDLRPDLTSLPVVPQSIVLLTGLSQAGYLTSKGISNLGSK